MLVDSEKAARAAATLFKKVNVLPWKDDRGDWEVKKRRCEGKVRAG